MPKKTQKKTETQAPTAPTESEFQNTTKRNVFTTRGRVMSGKSITLLIDEGEATKGLERA